MGDRYFANEMPAFVEEAESVAAGQPSSLFKLLHLPYPKAAEKFLQAALDLKERVVKETWGRHGRSQGMPRDWSLYTGSLGTAFLLFKSYLFTKNAADLSLSADIISFCHDASRRSTQVSFICGRAGVCALGAVVAKHLGDTELLAYYLNSFMEIKLLDEVPNELLYGRAGYLWACSFLNTHIGEGTIPSSTMAAIAKDVVRRGKLLSVKRSCPLMYQWHGKMYWGAAHGLAGIMHVLMDTELDPEEQELVKGTLNYMINNRFPGGNYPSSEGSDSDRLVHWCHGAPGVALTLAKAAKVFGSECFLTAAEEAAAETQTHLKTMQKRIASCVLRSISKSKILHSKNTDCSNIGFRYRHLGYAFVSRAKWFSSSSPHSAAVLSDPRTSDGMTVDAIVAKGWPILDEGDGDWKSHAAAIAQSIQLIKKRLQESMKALLEMRRNAKEKELEALLSGDNDSCSCFVEVQAGAGGTESMDWASMVMNMYMMWAQHHGYEVTVVDQMPGEIAGIKRATIKVDGEYAYGYAKAEVGVHRLVRISPFDSGKRRHTSFAAVAVIPILGDVSTRFQIKESDLRIERFRSGGAGGQHANTTDSAVRIVHIPTGISATCQNERSQHSNKASAMAVLQSRLDQLEMARQAQLNAEHTQSLTDISWGNQIRTYVLHPYRMVKDLRTNYEVSDPDSVMEGDLDGFILNFLSASLDKDG